MLKISQTEKASRAVILKLEGRYDRSTADAFGGLSQTVKARMMLKAFDINVLPMTADIERVVKRLGIIGFSAGGHLAARTSTSFGERSYPAIDAIDQKSCRPDFAVLAYPVISLVDPVAHAGSRRNLLGENPTERRGLDARRPEHGVRRDPLDRFSGPHQDRIRLDVRDDGARPHLHSQ